MVWVITQARTMPIQKRKRGEEDRSVGPGVGKGAGISKGQILSNRLLKPLNGSVRSALFPTITTGKTAKSV